MNSRVSIQIVLIFLSVAISGFDRHLSNYFPGEVVALIQSDAIPSHTDLPVKSCDNHEDITFKTNFYSIPAPVVVSVKAYRLLHIPIPRVSSHTVWQPPETIA